MQIRAKTLEFESDIAELLTAYFEEKHRLGYKYTGIDVYLKSFDKYLCGKECKTELSREVMLEWVARKPHQKATTVKHNIYTMQNLADFLNRNGLPTYRIPNTLIPQVEHDFTPYIFNYSEIDKIIAEFDLFQYNKSSPRRHFVYPMLFRILCFCGLRISEALNLKVKDVDFEQGCLFLRDTKNLSDRLIPLDANLKERVNGYAAQMRFLTSEDYFFPSPDGYRYSICTIETTFRGVMNKVGIPYRGRGKGPRLHDLRHTFCVHSLQKLTTAGKSPYAALPVLMTYMGHKSVNATSRYIHLSAESYPALLKQTEAVFGHLIPLEDETL
jgi:integrase